VHSADPNVKPNPSQAVKTPESVWNDLDAHVRERALRILSKLCHAYLKATDIDSALENDDSENGNQVSKDEAEF